MCMEKHTAEFLQNCLPACNTLELRDFPNLKSGFVSNSMNNLPAKLYRQHLNSYRVSTLETRKSMDDCMFMHMMRRFLSFFFSLWPTVSFGPPQCCKQETGISQCIHFYLKEKNPQCLFLTEAMWPLLPWNGKKKMLITALSSSCCL